MEEGQERKGEKEKIVCWRTEIYDHSKRVVEGRSNGTDKGGGMGIWEEKKLRRKEKKGILEGEREP